MQVNYGMMIGTVLSLAVSTCLLVQPPSERLPGTPLLTNNGMTTVRDPAGGYREAVHLQWRYQLPAGSPLHSFSLLRRFSTDSLFDLFPGSRLIPADTADFYDELANYSFPSTGTDSVFYRLFGVDTLGRSGDTSAVCVVVLVPPPGFVGYVAATRCIAWESWIRGGVVSWCVVWNATGGKRWTSENMVDFPDTDKPARFMVCVPDSLRALVSGTWYYALYIRANEAYALTVGSTDAR